MDERRQAQACELVVREARLLDERAWDAWLALYEEDAQLWVPTWRDEQELTEDPASELSFMFLQGRAMLAERVFRITSGRSAASTPLPRTNHLVTGLLVAARVDATVQVQSAWTSHVYQQKDGLLVTYTGRYEHELAWDGHAFRIRRKKIILLNDRLASPLDFFHL
jgi:3-phenylpropionate/cinnamic acid dioxygenase small subunit